MILTNLINISKKSMKCEDTAANVSVNPLLDIDFSDDLPISQDQTQIISRIRSLIIGLSTCLRKISHPQTQNQVKECVNSLKDHDNWDISGYIFSEELQDHLESLFKELKKIPREKNNYCSTIIEQINNIQTHKKLGWEPAIIFMNLEEIKGLSDHFKDQIASKIEFGTSQEIQRCLEELYQDRIIDRTKLEAQASTKTLRGEKLHQLSTLILRVVKERPRGSAFLKKILDQKENLKFFVEKKMIEVVDKEKTAIAKGNIITGELKDRFFSFFIEDIQRGEVTINFYHDNFFISWMSIESADSESLEEYLERQLNLLKENKRVFQTNLWVQRSQEFFTGSELPSEAYKITITFEEVFKQYSLQFKSERAFNFTINTNSNGLPLSVKNTSTGQTFSYSEFGKAYVVKKKTFQQMTFSDASQNDKCIKLSDKNNRNVISTINLINNKKDQMISKIVGISHSNPNPENFNILMSALLQNQQISLSQFSEIQLEERINELLILYGKVDQQITKDKLLHEVLTEVNYSSLIQKEKIVTSMRVVQLFAKSEVQAATMYNKDIIIFYGNTGSGKSTSVNYFMRKKLKTTKNAFGESTIEVDEESNCKIGHSNCISETLYAQGHQITPSEDETDLKNDIVLCDCPGFKDTRGTVFEVCTSLSMDRAIDVSRSILAIVLVIPYSQLGVSNRGNNLIQQIHQMQEKFPSLLEENSKAFERFFILITKSELGQKSSEQSLSFLKSKFQTSKEQLEIMMYRQMKKNMDTWKLNKKIEIFKALILMCQKQHIDFIAIDDSFEREQILRKYIHGMDVSKNLYASSIESNQLVREFSNEISGATYNWAKLIFEPYQSLPNSIKNLESQVIASENTLRIYQDEIDNIKIKLSEETSKLESANVTFEEHKKTFERVKNQDFSIEEKELIESEEKIQLPDYIEQFSESIQQSRQEIQKHTEEIFSLNEQIQRKQSQLQELQKKKKEKEETWDQNVEKIKKMKQGVAEQIFVDESYTLYQDYQFSEGTSTYDERLAMMEKGETLPETENIEVFKIGKEQICLAQIIKIEKDYQIVPSQDFDPNSYLQSVNTDGYFASIKSQGYILEGVREHEDGKTLLLSVLIDFPITKNPKKLPYFQLIHTISSAELNKKEIENTDADNRKLIVELEEIAKSISQEDQKKKMIEEEIMRLQKAIIDKESHIEKMEEQNKKALELRKQEIRANTRAEKTQTLKKQKEELVHQAAILINSLSRQIEMKTDELEMKKQQRQRMENNKTQAENKIQQLSFKLQRIKFLIKDQLRKNIPQSIKEFSNIAIGMCKRRLNTNKIDGKIKESLEYKLKNFEVFLEKYKQIQKELLQLKEENAEVASYNNWKRRHASERSEMVQIVDEEEQDRRKKKIKLNES